MCVSDLLPWKVDEVVCLVNEENLKGSPRHVVPPQIDSQQLGEWYLEVRTVPWSVEGVTHYMVPHILHSQIVAYGLWPQHSPWSNP